VDGCDAIFNYWESREWKDVRWLAYILATVYHETGTRMAAVRETFADDDEQAISRITKYINGINVKRKAQGKVPKANYALRKANGKSYYGRGLVQITHDYNYLKVGNFIDVDLYNEPDLALDLEVSVKCTIEGMVNGLFTGASLSDYFNKQREDWVRARQIVNGLDRAEKIGDYGKIFWKCLT
jgi:predicted chitinase